MPKTTIILNVDIKSKNQVRERSMELGFTTVAAYLKHLIETDQEMAKQGVFIVNRPKSEIVPIKNKCFENINDLKSSYANLSYESGVYHALEWMTNLKAKMPLEIF